MDDQKKDVEHQKKKDEFIKIQMEGLFSNLNEFTVYDVELEDQLARAIVDEFQNRRDKCIMDTQKNQERLREDIDKDQHMIEKISRVGQLFREYINQGDAIKEEH